MRRVLLSFLLSISTLSYSQLSVDSLLNELDKSHGDSLETLIYRDISWEYFNIDLDSALYYANMSLKSANRSKSGFCLSKAYYVVGVTHYYRAEYSKASKNVIMALKMAEKVPGTKTLGMKNVMAAIYIASGEPEKAFDIYRKLRVELTQKKDSANLELIIGNIGSTYFSLGEYDSCIYYMKYLQNFENSSKVSNWSKIASSYEAKDMHDSALYYCEKVLNQGIGESEYLRALKLKSRILNNTEKYQEAILMNRKVAELSKELKNIEFLSDAYNGIHYNYEGLNRFDSALYYYREHIKLKDSISKMGNLAAIEEVNTKYQTEKKELQIANQEAELKQRKYLEYGLVIGIIMLAFLGVAIYLRYKEKNKANVLLTEKNEVIELKNQEITDSIKYAKRIQQAILPTEKINKEHLGDHFVFYRPKDIVSGDFYWVHPLEDGKVLFAAIDCTGHGVPGAFVSIVGFNLLNKMVDDLNLTQPAEILTNLNKYMADSLTQKGSTNVKDGMDISLCLYDPKNLTLQYAGANNSLYLIRKGELTEIKADKLAIGSYYFRDEKFFQNHEIKLEKEDCIYSFTDGFADQFGGPKGKKFMYRQFKKLLSLMAEKPMDEQKKMLNHNFDLWKGDLEQLDDICIIGVRV